MKKILIVNIGSSTLKFHLYDMCKNILIKGICSSKKDKAKIKYVIIKDKEKEYIKETNTKIDFVSTMLKVLKDSKIIKKYNEIVLIGHRIAHGGFKFNESVIVNEFVENEMKNLFEFAPLHIPYSTKGYFQLKKAIPTAKHVFSFDTSFYNTLLEENYLYPIPYEYFQKYNIKKYGAHGLSHNYLYKEAKKYCADDTKFITCHLGGGSSVSAIKNGICINTSMGFTPIDGVVMCTRTGRIDPSIIPYLCKKENKSADEIIEIFNKKSGLLGISQISSDFELLETFAKKGEKRAKLAVEMYVKSISSIICDYVMELNGCDCIVFGGGIGENSSYLRRKVISRLNKVLSIDLDFKNNINNKEGIISTKNSNISILLIHTNEEEIILNDIFKLFIENNYITE